MCIRDRAVLVAYTFRFGDKTFTKHLYVPYIYEDSSFVVNGTRYEAQLAMAEKLFSTTSRSNGVTIKVIRSPIKFWQTVISYRDLLTDEIFTGSIVSCKIYAKDPPKSARRIRPTVVHYLLCKYSVGEVFEKFGAPKDSASFIRNEKMDPKFYYFKAQDRALDKDPVILKVNKEVMDTNRGCQDVVSAIVYLLSGIRNPTTLEWLYSNSTELFRILLGKIIYVNIDKNQALNAMNRHFESVDNYLDSYTKKIYEVNGIFVNDIYDLLVFVAQNIGQIVINYPNNNMYNKRLETITSVIIDGMFRYLYDQIYKFERKKNNKYMEDNVSSTMRISPTFILSSLGTSESTRFCPSVNNDNWLLSVGSKGVKKLSAIKNGPGTKKNSGGHLNSPMNRFSPSMITCESLVGFGSSPGSTFMINPYSEIDSTGGFIKTPEMEELEKLINPILPR